MLNTLVRGAMGHNILFGSISITNLFNEKFLEKITVQDHASGKDSSHSAQQVQES